MTPDESTQLEAAARRPFTGDVWHPDNCQKLRIHGAGWSVQPLYPPEGVQWTPVFSGDSADVQVSMGEAKADEALVEFAQKLVDAAPVEYGQECPECHRPLDSALSVDMDKHAEFLRLLFSYALRILRKQYELTDEQASSLLAFQGDRLPRWVGQVLSHAMGLDTEPPPVPQVQDITEAQLQEHLQELMQAAPVEVTKYPWWKFWKR